MSEFARPFRITYPDGEVLDGVQFPSGRCAVDTRDPFSSRSFVELATAFEHLKSIVREGAVVEWADGGQP